MKKIMKCLCGYEGSFIRVFTGKETKTGFKEYEFYGNNIDFALHGDVIEIYACPECGTLRYAREFVEGEGEGEGDDENDDNLCFGEDREKANNTREKSKEPKELSSEEFKKQIFGLLDSALVSTLSEIFKNFIPESSESESEKSEKKN
jgi:hypothetical protein